MKGVNVHALSERTCNELTYMKRENLHAMSERT